MFKVGEILFLSDMFNLNKTQVLILSEKLLLLRGTYIKYNFISKNEIQIYLFNNVVTKTIRTIADVGHKLYV